MTDQWNDRLSEYIDDELTPAERAQLEMHLTTCRECAVTLDELREVVARAGSLTPRPPAADLWPASAASRAIGDGRAVPPRRRPAASPSRCRSSSRPGSR
jgi:anti-sigma factor RsiW